MKQITFLLFGWLTSNMLYGQSKFLSSWNISGAEVKVQLVDEGVAGRFKGFYTLSEFQSRLKNVDDLPQGVTFDETGPFFENHDFVPFIIKGGLLFTRQNPEKENPTWTHQFAPKISLAQNDMGTFGWGFTQDGGDTIFNETYHYADRALRLGLWLGYRLQYNFNRRWFLFGEANVQADFSLTSQMEELHIVAWTTTIPPGPVTSNSRSLRNPGEETTRNIDSKPVQMAGGSIAGGFGANLSSKMALFLTFENGLAWQNSRGVSLLSKEFIHAGFGVIHFI